MNALKSLVLMLGVLWSAPGHAQDAFTLEAAIEYAYNNSLTVRNSLINVEDAEAQILERRASGLPQINGSLNFNHYLKVPKQALPEAFLIGAPPGTPREVSFFLQNNFTAGANAQQMIFDGSFFVALRAARQYRSYVQAELVAAKQDVKNQVTSAYLAPLILAENAEFLRKNITNISNLLRETSALYEAGFVEQLDVDRLQLSLSNLETELENLNRQEQVAKNFLKLAMGYPVQDDLVITDQLDELLETATATELTTDVPIRDRPEYQVILLGEQLNQSNVENIEATRLPSAYANAGYQWQYQGDDFSSGFWAEQANVGLQVNVPIFDGYRRRSQVQRARLQGQILSNQRRDLERLITAEVTNAREQYRNAARRIDFQERNLELANKIYDTAQIKYRDGVGSSIEVQQAEQTLYQTQQNFTQAAYDLVVAKSDLDRALGR